MTSLMQFMSQRRAFLESIEAQMSAMSAKWCPWGEEHKKFRKHQIRRVRWMYYSTYTILNQEGASLHCILLHCNITRVFKHTLLDWSQQTILLRFLELFAKCSLSIGLYLCMRRNEFLTHVFYEISTHSPNFLDAPCYLCGQSSLGDAAVWFLFHLHK